MRIAHRHSCVRQKTEPLNTERRPAGDTDSIGLYRITVKNSRLVSIIGPSISAYV